MRGLLSARLMVIGYLFAILFAAQGCCINAQT
jgi:hypothetical protein